MSDLTPLTREEIFLNAIAEGEDPNLTPVTREEHFLKNIYDAVSQGGGGGGSSNLIVEKLTPEGSWTYVTEHTYTANQLLNMLDSGVMIMFVCNKDYLTNTARETLTLYELSIDEYEEGSYNVEVSIHGNRTYLYYNSSDPDAPISFTVPD